MGQYNQSVCKEKSPVHSLIVFLVCNAQKTFKLEQLVNQTPLYLMTPPETQQFNNLSAEISSRKVEFCHGRRLVDQY
jgi:hypothetical protein